MPVKTEETWGEYSSSFEKMDWEDDWNFKLLDLPTSEFMTSAAECELYANSTFNLYDAPPSPKYQIRHHDCMWSGTCVDQSHPGKIHEHQSSTCEHSGSSAVSTFSATTAAQLHTTATNSNVTVQPVNKPTSVVTAANNQQKNTIKAQQIPAGRSLLINPRNKQQQQQKVPTLSTTDFLKDREHVSLIARPDTPLSLDDDPPEFKHNIDLATCTMGSNKMSLIAPEDSSSARIINMLKEHLEESTVDNGMTKSLNAEIRSYMSSSVTHADSLTDLLKDLKYLSDYEELDEESDDSEASSSGMSSSSKGGGSHLLDSSHFDENESSNACEYQATTHDGDHSYTRPKNRYNMTDLGVQTPSDSEEEIDVVSIGDKNLPTNPTARDRYALQTTVAHKIRKGARQIPQRRRCSGDDFTSTPTKVNGLSPNYITPASSSANTGANTPLYHHHHHHHSSHHQSAASSSSSSSSRKRPSNKQDYSTSSSSSSKKNRGKKQRNAPPPIPVSRKTNSDSDEADTLEKRNLHNDMERQRRIGLKNLFEQLKREIPSIRDKERAPKVNILREAASLCNKLNREQQQLDALRKQQSRLYARVRQLRSSLHSQRRLVD